MQRDTSHPTGLPPVRKRKEYSDVSGDDLTFALYHDRIAGDGDAMSEAGEWTQSSAAAEIATIKSLIAETVALVEQVKALGFDARNEF